MGPREEATGYFLTAFPCDQEQAQAITARSVTIRPQQDFPFSAHLSKKDSFLLLLDSRDLSENVVVSKN